MGAAATPLLTLRDLLELSCESSCSDGFRSYPRRLPWHGEDAVQAKAEAAPVRLLIEADLRRSPSRTLSSILFPRSPGSLATVSRLTRSLSRRLVFWRRHREEDTDDADDRDSLSLPSPVVSSCSASECAAEWEADGANLLVLEGQTSGASDESEKPSTSPGCTGSVDDGAADGDGHSKEALDGDPAGLMMEEKQQLSPVSVLDLNCFHDEEEDDDRGGDERSDGAACSPSSSQPCQPDPQRSTSSAREPLHKIRRRDGLARQGVDLDPVDLETRSDRSGLSVSDGTHSQSDSRASSTDQDSAATTTLDGLAKGLDVDTVDLVTSGQSGESDDAQAQSSSCISSTTDDSAATTSTTVSSDEQRQQQSTDDDAESARAAHHHHRLLLARLREEGGGKAAASCVATETRLLLDFFAEGLDQRRSAKAGPVLGTVKPPDDRDEAALVHAAKEWAQGGGTQWGVEDVLFSGAAALADMDRERRWVCFREEEREAGVVVWELVMDALLAELVSDLALAGLS